jgi:hypothetical protein
MIPQKIYLRKVRDFGQVFGASFTYIKQHFKHFFGSIILLAGPFALISGLCTAYMMNSMFSLSGIYGNSSLSRYGDLILPYTIVILAGIIGHTIYTTVVNQHLILNEGMDATQKPTVGQIASSFFKVYWHCLGAWFLLFVLTIIFVILLFLVIMLFVGIGSLGGGVLAAILGILAYIFLLLIVFPAMSFVVITSLFLVQRDKIGLFEAMRKTVKYLRGNFWMTWLVAFVSGIVTYMAFFIAILPAYIMTIITTFSRVKEISTGAPSEVGFSIGGYIMWAVSYLIGFCVLSVFYLMCTYQFTSLEEKKEGKSILDKINAIS